MPPPHADYRSNVQEKLKQISDFLPNIAMGDFSKRFDIPSENDDFAEIYVSLNYMMDDIQDNISRRIQTEKKLRESEERYRNLVENSKDSIVVIDPKGNVQYANKTSFELTGYSLAEGIGMNVKDITLKRYWPRSLSALRKAKKGEAIPYFESKIRKKDGTTLTVETGGQPIIKNGKVEGVQIITRDLTESKRIKEELIESEERYRTLVETAPDGIASVNLKGTVTSVNNTFLKLTGFSREEIQGKHYSKLPTLRKKDMANYIKIFSSIMRGKTPDPFEITWTHKDGSEHAAEICISLMKKGKKPAGIQAVARDITDRKKVEEALRNSIAYWQTTFDAIEDSICLVDKERKVLQCNKSTMVMVGKPMKFILDHNICNVIHGSSQSHKYCPLDRMLKSKSRESTTIKLNNRWFNITVDPIMNKKGKLINAVHIMTDITENKMAEEALMESQEKLRAIFDNVNDVIVHVDSFGEITEVNSRVEDIFGIKREEAIGRNFMDLEFMDKKDMEKMIEMFIASAEKGAVISSEGESVNRMELTIKNKNGKDVFIETNTSALKKDGELVGFSTTIRDISERKQAEESIKESEQKYSSVVENSQDAILIHQDGIIKFVNSAASRLTNYKAGDLIGRNFLEFISKDYHELVMKRYTDRKKGLEVPYVYEISMLDKDGSQIPVEISSSIISYEDKKTALVFLRDISERKKAEEETRFQAMLLNKSSEFIIASGLDGKLTYANKAIASALGSNPEELIGHTMDIFSDRQDGESKIVLMQKAMEEGQWIGERTMQLMNGKEIDVDLHVQLLHNEKGEPKSIFAIGHDITEKKKAQLAILESEQRLKTIFMANPDFTYLTDTEGNIMDANPALLEAQNISLEEIKEKNILELFPGENPQMFKKVSESLKKGKEIRGLEIKAKLANGEHRDYEIHAIPLKEGGKVNSILNVARDITERKKVRDSLIKERDKAQSYLDIAGVMFVAIDDKGIVTLINKKGCEILGCEEVEILGKNWFENFIPERIIHEIIPISKMLLAGDIEPVEYSENSVLTRSGKERTIAWHNTSIKDESGRIIGHLSSGEDITERKQAQLVLIQSKKLASVGQLAAGVAHELNNPLANISLITANMSKMTNDPELLEKLRSLSEQGKLAKNIVQSLLNFSRKIEPNFRDVRLVDSISQSIAITKTRKPKNITINTKFDSKSLRVKADLEQLKQVFVNIIDNAFDAMPEGGRLVITSVQDGKHAKISFSDSGIGLSKEDMENIFDPFYTTKGVGSGIGLGLSICHGIVTSHNGSIIVDSEKGKGTTFTIKLPVG